MTSTNATEEDRGVYDTVVAKFDAFFKVRRNVIFKRARFNRRSQLAGEPAEQFIMELYTLAEHCNYGDMTDEMIRDRLVVGIQDAALSQLLQLDAELTLEKAKKKGFAREKQWPSSSKRSKEQREEQINLNGIHSRHAQQSRAAAGKPCTRCGKGQHPRDRCPAKEATCYRCQKKGHYSSQCFSKQDQDSEVPRANHIDAAFLDTVSSGDPRL